MFLTTVIAFLATTFWCVSARYSWYLVMLSISKFPHYNNVWYCIVYWNHTGLLHIALPGH